MGNKRQERDMRLCSAWIHRLLPKRFSRRECTFADYKSFAPTIVVRDRRLIHVDVHRDLFLLDSSFLGALSPLQIRKNLGSVAGSGREWCGACHYPEFDIQMSTPSHFMKVLDPKYMDTFCFQKWVVAQSRHISAVPEMGTSLQKANIGVPSTSASDAPEM